MIHYTGQRHRGACSATEEPGFRRKYAKKRRNLSFDAHRTREHEAFMAEFEAFLDAGNIRAEERAAKLETMNRILDRFCSFRMVAP